MPKLLKEPLLHFLLLGGCLFALFHWTGGSEEQGKQDKIVVSSGRIENLARTFEKTWQRPPTEQELDGLIQEHVREEIMVREALSLGLDRDDTIIRRRLRQKMEFLYEDVMSLRRPSEKELSEYLQKHPDRFRRDARLTFQHVFLNAEKRGDTLNSNAQSLLDELQKREEGVGVTELGDRFLLPDHFEAVSEHEIRKMFGQRFIETLMQAPTQKWHGPVVSSYGVHLVYISERIDARTPSLNEVRDVVEREWSVAKRKEANEAFYEGLRGRYTVAIEKPQRVPSREIAMTEVAE